jgi:hypothetical protein
MRTLAATLFLVFLSSSTMARNFDVGGNSKGDCDDRRGPNATSCLYFGNPYYDSATGTFSNSINPYYNSVSGTFSSLAPGVAVMRSAPRRVRRSGH